jgi:hypothetical protein
VPFAGASGEFGTVPVVWLPLTFEVTDNVCMSPDNGQADTLVVPPSQLRWRERPRLSMIRWDASDLYIPYAICVVGFWWAVPLAVDGAITGNPETPGGHSRVLNGVLVPVLLIAALALSRLTWLFLARPVVDRRTYEAELEADRRLRPRPWWQRYV